VGYEGHIVHSGQEMSTHFLMLRWDRYGFDKKCDRTHYVELVFLQPVVSVVHVVHSGAYRHEMLTHYFDAWLGLVRFP
jgi:hypothetical protein